MEWLLGLALAAGTPYHETPAFNEELQAALEKNLAVMSEVAALEKTARDVCLPHGVTCFEREIELLKSGEGM